MPAVVQAIRTGGNNPKPPLWQLDDETGSGLMAPPRLRGQKIPKGMIADETVAWSGSADFVENQQDQISQWNRQLGQYFELGTVYTMIAGLLNILAIFDACAGQ